MASQSRLVNRQYTSFRFGQDKDSYWVIRDENWHSDEEGWGVNCASNIAFRRGLVALLSHTEDAHIRTMSKQEGYCLLQLEYNRQLNGGLRQL